MIGSVIMVLATTGLPLVIGYYRVDTTTRWSPGWFACGALSIVRLIGIGCRSEIFTDNKAMQIGDIAATFFTGLLIKTAADMVFDWSLYLGHLCAPKIEGKTLREYVEKEVTDIKVDGEARRGFQLAFHSSTLAYAIHQYLAPLSTKMRQNLYNQPVDVLTMPENQFHAVYQYNPDMQRLLLELRGIVKSRNMENEEVKGSLTEAISHFADMKAKYNSDSTCMSSTLFISLYRFESAENLSTNSLRNLELAYVAYKIFNANLGEGDVGELAPTPTPTPTPTQAIIAGLAPGVRATLEEFEFSDIAYQLII